MNWIRPLLRGLGIALVALGVIAVVEPTAMMEPAGLVASVDGALTEIRAVYGGFQIGLGLFLLWSALDPTRWPAALLVYALILGAIGDCRAIGLLIDRAPTPFHWFALAFEWVTAGLTFYGYFRTRMTTASGSREEPAAAAEA